MNNNTTSSLLDAMDTFGTCADILAQWPEDRTLGQRDLANTHMFLGEWLTVRQFALVGQTPVTALDVG